MFIRAYRSSRREKSHANARFATFAALRRIITFRAPPEILRGVSPSLSFLSAAKNLDGDTCSRMTARAGFVFVRSHVVRRDRRPRRSVISVSRFVRTHRSFLTSTKLFHKILETETNLCYNYTDSSSKERVIYINIPRIGGIILIYLKET